MVCGAQHTVEFLGKYARPDKIAGALLREISGNEPVWKWRPEA